MEQENRQTFIDRLMARNVPQADIDEILFAYEIAKEAHRTHMRGTGDRYFEHIRAVALIMLDELDWYDKTMLISMLLHDVGEDSGIFGNRTRGYEPFVKIAEYRIGKIFGPDVAHIVVLLTKPAVDGVRFHSKPEAYEYYRQRLETDPRAIIGKMVDRLHNLRTLDGVAPEKRTRKLAETKNEYVPIFAKVATGDEYQPYASILFQKIQDELRAAGE